MKNDYITNKLTRSDYFILILSIAFLIHKSPYIGAQMPAMLYALIVSVLFIALASKFVNNSRVTKTLLFVLAPIILNIFFKSGGTDRSIFMVISGIMQASIPPLLSLYVLKRDSMSLALFLFLFYYGVEIVTYITSTLATEIDPLIVRLNPGELKENDIMLYQLKKSLNVGNFDTVYGCLLLIPICVIAFKNRNVIFRNKFSGLLPIVAIMISYFFLFKAQFAIAFLLGILMLSLFFIPLKITSSFFKRSLVFAAILLIIFRFSLAPTLHYVATALDNEAMTPRIEGFANMLEGNVDTVDEDTESRSNHYKRAIDSIKEYTIFGSWGRSASSGHSVLLDSLALYGILGVFLIYRYLNEAIKMIASRSYVSFIYFYYYGIVVVVFLFCVNPSLFLPELFFCYPVSCYIFSKLIR